MCMCAPVDPITARSAALLMGLDSDRIFLLCGADMDDANEDECG